MGFRLTNISYQRSKTVRRPSGSWPRSSIQMTRYPNLGILGTTVAQMFTRIIKYIINLDLPWKFGQNTKILIPLRWLRDTSITSSREIRIEGIISHAFSVWDSRIVRGKLFPDHDTWPKQKPLARRMHIGRSIVKDAKLLYRPEMKGDSAVA